MEYSRILKEIYEEIQPYAQEGKPASYIPELLKVNPDRYGICLRTIEGKEYAQGDSDERFAVQSISKVFSLAMSFGRIGNELWKRIGVEPYGSCCKDPPEEHYFSPRSASWQPHNRNVLRSPSVSHP